MSMIGGLKEQRGRRFPRGGEKTYKRDNTQWNTMRWSETSEREKACLTELLKQEKFMRRKFQEKNENSEKTSEAKCYRFQVAESCRHLNAKYN